MSAKEILDVDECFWARDADPEACGAFECLDCDNAKLGSNTEIVIPAAANANLSPASFRITEPPP